MIIQRGDISTTGATPEGRQGVIFTTYYQHDQR